jgi:hypothetical protein
MTIRKRLASWAIALAVTTAQTATGEEPAASCKLHAKMSTTRMIRRTALALIGRVPTLDEYLAVKGLSYDDPKVLALIDGWMQSDEHRIQMRRMHMDLLWANPGGVQLRDLNITLARVDFGNKDFYWRLQGVGRKLLYRGGNGTHDCQNVDQAKLGYTNGVPNCQDKGYDESGKPYCQEGWVTVKPYVDPATPMKVCAFDAQTTLTWTNAGQTLSCGDVLERGSQKCGCGPDLRFCMFGAPYLLDPVITSAMQEQLLLSVDDYTRGQAPYRELLTSKKSYSNGQLDFFMKHVAPGVAFNRVYVEPHTGDAALKPDWLDTKFREVTRGKSHSGILTTPAYTLRFQTNRGRANRFRIAFLGQYYLPPSNTPAPGCDVDAVDLTKRCICQGCHKTLEPLAARFGSISEAGSALLSDFPKEFPSQAECNKVLGVASLGACNRFYTKLVKGDPDHPGVKADVWRLKPLEWIDSHPEQGAAYASGPAGLVADEALKKVAGKPYSYLAWSITRHVFSTVMARDFDLDPTSEDNEQALLDKLAGEFEKSDFNFRTLVRSVATLPEFRRMP